VKTVYFFQERIILVIIKESRDENKMEELYNSEDRCGCSFFVRGVIRSV
jgi:hypothetical protein